MIENFFNYLTFNNLQFFLAVFFFINVAFFLFLTIYVGRFNFIKKMDKHFNQPAFDLGLILNSYRAFAYGMSIVFPNSLGKKVHKNINISLIPEKDKFPFKLLIYSSFFLYPYFIYFLFL